MTARPHILFIILDTLRRDHLGVYGDMRRTSPFLDEFAQNATIFDRAISPAQWTIPAHASLFTGTYPGTHGLHQAYQRLSGSHPTLAEILQVAEYHTVAFCNNPLLGILETDLQRGFDHFFNYAGATPDRPVDMRRSAARRAAAANLRQLARRISNEFAHSDFLFRMSLSPAFVPIWSRLVNFKGNTTQSLDDLLSYWQQHHAGGAEKPLFTYLNLMGAHTPYRPPQQYLDAIAPDLKRDKQAFRFMAQHNADGLGWISPPDAPLADWQQYTLDSFYAAEIAYQDFYLGRLLNGLKQAGILDNTLVIISADHGEGHGDHGFNGHSFVVYQELVHVPLIVHYPAHFPAGKRVQTGVSTRRIFHTILEAAGVKPPLDESDPNANISGLSLLNAVNGRPDTENGIVYSEAFPPVNLLNILERNIPETVTQLQLAQVRRGVYAENYKLAVVGNQVEQLFDVASDPAETHNIAAEQPQAVQQLQRQLEQFVTQSPEETPSTQTDVSDEVLANLRALGYVD
jgi:uncharacterized sulfatase